MKKIISIITATFNAESALPGLIESLRKQDSELFEWVVVDGASNDGTLDLLRSATGLDIKISSSPDFGVYDAINKGVRNASGDYYIVAGADDRFAEEAIAKYVEVIRSDGADLVSANIHSGGRLLTPGRGLPWFRGQNAYISNHSIGVAIKRSLHDRYGLYSNKFPIAADHLFIKRVCGKAERNIISNGKFIAGEFGDKGVSSSDVAGLLTEFFRVQLLTEKWKSVQVAIFLVRLMNNLAKIGK